MERIAILISEIGGAGAVVFGASFYLFKSTFKQMIEPLSKSIDGLTFNVGLQTDLLKEHKNKLDTLENRVNGHDIRIEVIEHDRVRGEK
ncbi:hypothetical protein [Leuconostoc citreum]|uniref:hypothetical protein n=1 Tax=Leuconostoc citreum TaxID=33964 RepID=UPI0025A2A02F|nr:hypothetical protein [Leuconostoc citreum]MDM7641106.1 hypothetical protein [Leuconostoc citreum]